LFASRPGYPAGTFDPASQTEPTEGAMQGWVAMYATQPISQGEELLWNYKQALQEATTDLVPTDYQREQSNARARDSRGLRAVRKAAPATGGVKPFNPYANAEGKELLRSLDGRLHTARWFVHPEPASDQQDYDLEEANHPLPPVSHHNGDALIITPESREVLIIGGQPPPSSAPEYERTRFAEEALPILPQTALELDEHEWIDELDVELHWAPRLVYVGPNAARRVGKARWPEV